MANDIRQYIDILNESNSNKHRLDEKGVVDRAARNLLSFLSKTNIGKGAKLIGFDAFEDANKSKKIFNELKKAYRVFLNTRDPKTKQKPSRGAEALEKFFNSLGFEEDELQIIAKLKNNEKEDNNNQEDNEEGEVKKESVLYESGFKNILSKNWRSEVDVLDDLARFISGFESSVIEKILKKTAQIQQGYIYTEPPVEKEKEKEKGKEKKDSTDKDTEQSTVIDDKKDPTEKTEQSTARKRVGQVLDQLSDDELAKVMKFVANNLK